MSGIGVDIHRINTLSRLIRTLQQFEKQFGDCPIDRFEFHDGFYVKTLYIYFKGDNNECDTFIFPKIEEGDRQ